MQPLAGNDSAHGWPDEALGRARRVLIIKAQQVAFAELEPWLRRLRAEHPAPRIGLLANLLPEEVDRIRASELVDEPWLFQPGRRPLTLIALAGLLPRLWWRRYDVAVVPVKPVNGYAGFARARRLAQLSGSRRWQELSLEGFSQASGVGQGPAPTSRALFFFDRLRLHALAERLRRAYARARPFPHVVIDEFLPDWVLEQVLEEFPGPHELDWIRYRGEHEHKLESRHEWELGPFTRHLLSQFNSATFLSFLEVLTGESGLITDPYLEGGGLHQIEPGGYLDVHADFNWYPRLRLSRRLNVLLYLNKDWKPDYGGHLELWDADLRRCVRRILPVFNRCVIFTTGDRSFHGHPDPLRCPEGRTRKSLALYYYVSGARQAEPAEAHSTVWGTRPSQVSAAAHA